MDGDVDQLFLALETGLRERTGQTTLDILVNNAAETVPNGTTPEEVTVEQFDTLFAVNAKAPFFITQRALELIPDGGRVVNISSGQTRVPGITNNGHEIFTIPEVVAKMSQLSAFTRVADAVVFIATGGSLVARAT